MGKQYFFLGDQEDKARALLEPFIAQAVLQGYLTTEWVSDRGSSREGFVLTEKAYAEGYDTPKRLLEVWLYRQRKAKEGENNSNGNV